MDHEKEAGVTHDKVREALPKMLAKAEAERGDPAKDHLSPPEHREALAHDAMDRGRCSTCPCSFPDVELEEDAESGLDDEPVLEHAGEARVRGRVELSPSMLYVTREAFSVAVQSRWSALP